VFTLTRLEGLSGNPMAFLRRNYVNDFTVEVDVHDAVLLETDNLNQLTLLMRAVNFPTAPAD